jgi:hypothetical protein
MEACTEGRRERLRENFSLMNRNKKAQDDRGSTQIIPIPPG